MSIRNLDKIFRPRSVALFGASERPGSIGAVAVRNLRQSGFRGTLMLVNPRLTALDGLPVYPDVAHLPEVPDLAVLITPPETVPELVAQLGARGTRAAVVITAGFSELGERGSTLQLATLEAARPYLLRLVGPNCVGVLVPAVGLNAGFAHLMPVAGDIAFVSQSGAMVTAVLDWAVPQGIGFSHVVSLGDMADVDFGDMLDFLGEDEGTRAILLYVEGITHARKFMSAARAAARAKPVVVVKVGRHAASARAAASHTGALAGADAVYEAAFRRAGMLRVRETGELFDAVETLALTSPQRGERLAILTNGGGPGVLATDALLDQGGTLAALAPATLAALDAALPRTWSRGNPVDIIGDAPGSRYAVALRALLADPGVDAVLTLNCPTAATDPSDAARAVVQVLAERPHGADGRNVFTSWLGRQSAEPARRILAAARVPSYETPDQAVRGFMHRVHHWRNQTLLLQVPATRPVYDSCDIAAGAAAIRAALAGGREWLDGDEVAALLAAYRIPAPDLRVVSDPDEAGLTAARMGFPVVLKIRSPDITHKSDVGGVMLNLESAARVRTEALAMAARVQAAQPAARITGFMVQQMIHRPGATELIVGVVDDATFGPVVLFGQGGIAVEAFDDSTLELPPLNDTLARAQIARTRVWKLLQGVRGRKPADLGAIADTLVRVSRLVSDHAEIRELDINPLLADADGVLALDARVRVGVATQPMTEQRGAARLAISPYPRELESTATLADGTVLRIRPVRPEDAPLLRELMGAAAPRVAQVDYDRAMVLLALAPDSGLFGLARYQADPDLALARYTLAVAPAAAGRGVEAVLLERLREAARQRGIAALLPRE